MFIFVSCKKMPGDDAPQLVHTAPDAAMEKLPDVPPPEAFRDDTFCSWRNSFF